MQISYYQKCPSCGAPIELTESDRLIKCSYCGVNNYRVARGGVRFVLPDRMGPEIADESIFYAPYLRLKGCVYTHRGTDIHHKLMDTTFRGNEHLSLPDTLGVRPQAMKPYLLQGQQVRGRFLPKTEESSRIFRRASMLIDKFSAPAKQKILYQSFIGETVSLIYQPVYLKDGQLFDGVLNRPFYGVKTGSVLNSAVKYSTSWSPLFLATLCPSCGAPLQGESDALVIHCHNCYSAWMEENGRFEQISWEAAENKRQDLPQLPFWRLSFSTEGVSMTTMADFLRATNQPVVARRMHELQPLRLLLPAFKIKPPLYLQLAKRTTMQQMVIKKGAQQDAGPLFPVTMPLTEAMESLKTVIAYSSISKKKLVLGVRELKIKHHKQKLVYLRFEQQGRDLVQPETRVVVPSAMLHYGRNL